MLLRRVYLVTLLSTAVALCATKNAPTPSSARAAPAASGPHPGIAGVQTVQSPVLGPIITIHSEAELSLEPAVAFGGLHDEYLVVWTSNFPTSSIIQAARVGSGGGVGGEFMVAAVATEDFDQPSVAYSPLQEEYLVVYVEDDPPEVQATRVRWDGSWIGAGFSVEQTAFASWCPAVAYNSQADEYLVVYSVTTLDGLSVGVTAQRVKASDGSLLSYAEVADVVGESRRCPDVAYNPARDEYLIAYGFHGSLHPKPYQIRGKVAASDLAGVTTSSEVTICCDDVGLEPAQVAVASGRDEYLVVFADRSEAGGDVYARRVSGAGAPQGSTDGFVISTAPHTDKAGQDVASSSTGRYLVAHSLQTTGKLGTETMDILGRYAMSNRNQPWGGEFTIDGSVVDQQNPATACAPSGDCLVVWEDNRSAAGGRDDYDLRGRFVHPLRVFLPVVLRSAP